MKKILITIAILLAILLIAIIAFLYRPVASKSVAADGETVDVVLRWRHHVDNAWYLPN